MSYTMTLDVPNRTAEYVERRGPRYRAELNAIFVAIVTANMQSDENETNTAQEEYGTGMDFLKRLRGNGPFLSDEEMHVFDSDANRGNGKAVFDAIRACPVDVDLGKLISKRTSCGRAHPLDFAAMRREDA